MACFGSQVPPPVDSSSTQMNHRDEWLACLRATFDGLDRDGDGRISTAEIMKVLSTKLPEDEVRGGWIFLDRAA